MSRCKLFLALFSVLVLYASTLSAQNLAPSPPMGWNSWDSYGFTIDEADFRANVSVLNGLQGSGYKYAVIDEGWYMANPNGKNVAEMRYVWDRNGLLIPDAARFPSAANGAGFKPLADWVHRQGMKFGVHIVRGIPRQVVEENLPIAGTSFHAQDAADKTSPCPWDGGNWGVADNAAGQAYYDSMFRLFARWGLDFVKVDCISDHPYRASEIRQIATAIKRSGRPMVLSLSPGPTNVKLAMEVQKYAQMWRISDDHWDLWNSLKHDKPGEEFGFGTREASDRLAKWYTYVGPDSWPDADMLPIGYLGPHPGWGEARQARTTQDEQRSEFALWCITRSPLILGANLTKLDDFTRSLVTNQTLVYMNQYATYSHPVDTAQLGAGFENTRVWRASINEAGARGYTEYFGFFNLDEKPVTLRTTWKQLGLDGAKHSALNAWDDSETKPAKEITVNLPPHGSVVYQVKFD